MSGRSGKDALFGEPVGVAGGASEGRRAFFSAATGTASGSAGAAPEGSGASRAQRPQWCRAAVRCRSCKQRSEVGPLALMRLLVPSIWLPAGRYNRLMRCPSCRRISWCSVDWSGLIPFR